MKSFADLKNNFDLGEKFELSKFEFSVSDGSSVHQSIRYKFMQYGNLLFIVDRSTVKLYLQILSQESTFLIFSTSKSLTFCWFGSGADQVKFIIKF